MKTLKQLIAAVGTVVMDDGTPVPWSNGKFADGEEPAPPFIVLVPGYSESAHADNRAWIRGMSYDVALYTANRDYALERKVAEALDAAEIGFGKTVSTIDGEGLIEAAFDVTVEEY